MPLYEFQCEDSICESINEELVASGTEFSTCKECGCASRKIMSLSSFHLKGGGWEKDGYASKSKGNKS